ncbi:MAG TPA: methylated-DNA--[protein]-cysteine S-methyltransferase [Desulfobacteria bacterium]|nr:methylated-DNA--[protein]-cysteine S-methyltransferase [Desulfobacteria bacterium]
MARTSLRKIYYWGMKLDRLHIHMASTEKGALRIGLGFNSTPDTKDFFKKLYPNSELLETYDVNRPLQQAVEAAFSNKEPQEALNLDVACTPFQWSAMNAIAGIPFGETRTYKEVAAMAGRPKGARAIGQAMGRNPLPLIFP